ncbi:MAG TPA: glycosyl transferase [Pseudonocardia sp.]
MTDSLISIAPAEPLGAPALSRPRVLDSVIITSYLLIAFGLYRDLWLHLGSGYLVDSSEDQNLFEWFFAVQARALAGGHPTLFSTLQNHPLGVNLMGNTAMPGLALPLAPVTWAFDPTTTWALILTGGLAGTATGWYLLFSRHLVRSHWAAAVGGGCCAFAPPVISHAVAHPNFTAMFLLPVIVGWLLRMTRPERRRRWARDGLVLGALVGWQVLIGEEPLLILATGLLVFTMAWAVLRPRTLLASARAALPGLGVGALVALLLVGYPLWVQFFGPASYHALPHGPAGNDLGSFGALPRQSLGGKLLHPDQVVDNPTEQNSFFGWPLLALLAVASVWLWREFPARLAAITMVVVLALSVGPHAFLDTHETPIPGPWLFVGQLPLFNSLIEARMSFAALPAMGMLLAMATDRALADWRGGRAGLLARRLWLAGLAVAVLPILPVRYTVTPRPDTPAFFASGAWRQYVRPGHTLVPVPLPVVGSAAALHWQVRAGLGFALPEGYFVGPSGPGDKQGMYGVPPRPTSRLLADTARDGTIPPVGPTQRAQAAEDLRYWQADAVVLPVDEPNAPALRTVLDRLLGPGEPRDGMLVWPVGSRSLPR